MLIKKFVFITISLSRESVRWKANIEGRDFEPKVFQWHNDVLPASMHSSVSKIFEGGGTKFRRFENNEDQNENVPAQNQVRFPAQT